MQIDQITEPVTEHGEGPVWDAATGRLHWVDMLRGDVLTMEESGGTSSSPSRQHLGDVVAAVRPRSGGGLVLAVERGFAVLDPGAGTARTVAEVWQDPSVRMNEGGCDPQGRFYAGSMAYDSRPGGGSLYRLDPDGTVSTLLDEVSVSNGIGWSPDDRTMYFTDTPSRRIYRYDFDRARGEIANRRVFAEVAPGHGGPDGMTVDAEGFVWSAQFDRWCINRYAPDGKLERSIRLPVQRPTTCMFGGPDLSILYVTSARMDLSEAALAEQPHAGGVFALDVGVKGLPEPRFVG